MNATKNYKAINPYVNMQLKKLKEKEKKKKKEKCKKKNSVNIIRSMWRDKLCALISWIS